MCIYVGNSFHPAAEFALWYVRHSGSHVMEVISVRTILTLFNRIMYILTIYDINIYAYNCLLLFFYQHMMSTLLGGIVGGIIMNYAFPDDASSWIRS